MFEKFPISDTLKCLVSMRHRKSSIDMFHPYEIHPIYTVASPPNGRVCMHSRKPQWKSLPGILTQPAGLNML